MVKDFFDGKGTLNFVAMDGVTDNGDNTYTIASVKAGESVTLNFTYVVVDGDAPEVLNAAVITTPKPSTDIVKSADKHIAKVNEIVTYTITVKNNSKDTLTNLLVSDTNNFKGEIEGKDGKGYTYNGDKTWTIATLESGKSIDITTMLCRNECGFQMLADDSNMNRCMAKFYDSFGEKKNIIFNNTKDLLDTIISVKLVDVKPMEVAENAIAG